MNQPGKDPQIGQDLRTLYDNTVPSGKILISVVGGDQVEDHVVVPIPKSYEAAMTIALQIFAENSDSTRPDISGGMSVKYRMKEPSGNFVWARIIPEFWDEVVKDGDHLRLASNASESQTEVSSVVGTLISNRQIVGHVDSKYVRVLLPKTYQRTKVMAIAKYNIPSAKTVRLYIRTKNDAEKGTVHNWVAIDPNIGAGWLALLNEAKDQYSTVEIWVKDF